MKRHQIKGGFARSIGGALALTVLWMTNFSAGRLEGAEPSTREKPAAAFFQPVQPPRPVQVMAHRGLMRQAPENTRLAIELAISDLLEWVEVDVRRSKDGIHLLAHDANLEGKTDGRGAVKDQEIAALQKLDAGSWFSRRFANTRLLTLAEALEQAKGRINLYLDIKDADPESLVAEVLKAGMQQQVVVYGSPEFTAKVRAFSRGRVPVMVKWHPSFGFGDWVTRVQPSAVEIDANEVTGEACREFHYRGIKVQAKTLGNEWDRPEVWSRMMTAGVDWIQTDFPQEVLVQSIKDRKLKKPVQIAFHRGASWYAPENTLPAIEKAKALGADYVEVDIRTSKDGHFFLLHDGQLGRTTNGHGPLKDLTSAELSKLEAGSWFSRPFAETPIPTFDAGLQALKGHAHVYLDAKEITPEALAAKIESYQIAEESVVYQHPDYLEKLKKLCPKVRVMPPLKDPKQIDALAARLKPYAVDAAWGTLSKDMIDRCHAHGIRVFSDALGLNENVPAYRQAIEWGIDLIQTDHPIRVWRAIELIDEASTKR